MKPRQALGYCLIALPYVGLFVVYTMAHGWMPVLAALGALVVVCGIITAGAWLTRT